MAQISPMESDMLLEIWGLETDGTKSSSEQATPLLSLAIITHNEMKGHVWKTQASIHFFSLVHPYPVPRPQ
jgi:hypothetical protein